MASVFLDKCWGVGTIWEVTLNPNLDPITKAHAVFKSPNGFAQNPEVFKADGKWTLLYDSNGDNLNGGYDIHVAQSTSPTHWSSETVLSLPGADQFGMVETPDVAKAAGGWQLYCAGTPSMPGPVSFADNQYILRETLAN